ncbi:MAG TPA: hypothetical protein VK060_17500 [Ruania sp.]|nr:hypothetical protein [Ruania sp.]
MSTTSRTDEKALQEAVAELEGIAQGAYGGAEGLDGASCHPMLTYLAEVAIGAAARGCSAQGWRTEVAKSTWPAAARDVAEAERCMRHAGLWPWYRPAESD